MQWSGGKRQCTDLADYIELDNSERLWFHQRPPAPAPNLISRWSPSRRSAWLDGFTPNVNDIFRYLCEQFAHFLEFPKEEAVGITATLALWTILTYAHPAWSAVPYLSVGGPLEFVPIDRLRHQLEVNLIGHIAVSQMFIPLLRKSQGRIINVGSVVGIFASPM